MNFGYSSNKLVASPYCNENEKKKKNFEFSQSTGLEDVEFALVHNNMIASNTYRDMEYPVKNGNGVCTCGGGYPVGHEQQEELEADTCCEMDCSDCGTLDCGDECIIL